MTVPTAWPRSCPIACGIAPRSCPTVMGSSAESSSATRGVGGRRSIAPSRRQSDSRPAAAHESARDFIRGKERGRRAQPFDLARRDEMRDEMPSDCNPGTVRSIQRPPAPSGPSRRDSAHTRS